MSLVPSPCSVCSHPDRLAIDLEIAHGGKSFRTVALQRNLSASAVARHKAHTLRAAGVAMAPRVKRGLLGRPAQGGQGFTNAVHNGLDRMMAGAGLAQEVQKLRARADNLACQAEANGDARTALLAIRELTRLLELQGRMMLEASAGRAADVASHPVWAELSGLIMHAIAPCERCKPLVQAAIQARLGSGPVA